jgi:hypothetical protein
MKLNLMKRPWLGALCARLTVALVVASALTNTASADADVSQCPAIHAQYAQLARELYAAGGCPLNPSAPILHILENGTDPNVKTCKVNEQAMEQWKAANGENSAELIFSLVPVTELTCHRNLPKLLKRRLPELLAFFFPLSRAWK